MREATLLPIPEQTVEWVRYMGDNLDEIKEFCNGQKIYLATDDSKELFMKEHGYIRVGDFVIYGYVNNYYYAKHYKIVSWKDFPRMIKEEIPVYLEEYREWKEKN